MRIDVISVFPELVNAVMKSGIPAQAAKAGLVQVEAWDLRDYTHDRHRTVDDRPYGGGPGMVMKPEPLTEAMIAVQAADETEALRIYMSPQGRTLDQEGIEYLASKPRLVLVAGRYEGIDERFIDAQIDEEWSIGDYVLSGGELPAMVLIDALIRQIPGALGHEESAAQDSFADGLLDCPHYTRPERFGDKAVPEVLTGGNHEAIRRWRLKQALGRTWQRRSDLLKNRNLSQEEIELLDEFKREHAQD